MRAFALLFVVACGTQPQTQAPTTVASASPEAPTVMPTRCARDSDCVVTDFTDCCAPCPETPRAMTRFDLERRTKACAEVECARQKGRTRCEPTERVDQFRAVCRDRACVAEPVAKATASPLTPPTQGPAETPALLTSSERCAKDSDCVVSNFASCCAPCRTTAYATSQKALEERTRVCAIVDCAGPPRNMTCPLVADALLYRASCRAGTCAGVKL